MATIDTSGLPPVLARLVAPWLDAIEASEPDMDDHVMAIAAHCSDALHRRVELTPALEQAFDEARAATDTLAVILGSRPFVPPWVRNGTRGALADLVEALGRAEANEVTKEIGLGW